MAAKTVGSDAHTKRAQRAGRLPIRSRRVDALHPQGLDDIGVQCPHRAAPVALEECVVCDDYEGLSLDGHGRTSFVRCRRAPPKLSDVFAHSPAVSRRVTPLPPPGTASVPAGAMTVGTIMTRNVVCVGPDLRVTEFAELLLEMGISGAPVVDDEGRPIGVVTRTDLLRYLLDEHGSDELGVDTPGDALDSPVHVEPDCACTVAEVMMPAVFSLDENASVAQAAALMAYEGVHRLVVIADDDRVVGMLSTLDILRWMAQESGYSVPPYTQAQRREP